VTYKYSHVTYGKVIISLGYGIVESHHHPVLCCPCFTHLLIILSYRPTPPLPKLYVLFQLLAAHTFCTTEAKMDSLPRLERAIEGLQARYPLQQHDSAMNNANKQSRKRQPIIVVTHAAACIGLAKAATKCALSDINPAGPCSIYRLDRDSSTASPHTSSSSSSSTSTSSSASPNQDDTITSFKKKNGNGTPCWTIDHYAKPHNGMNGYLGHLTNWGTATVPWNNFGPRDTSNGHSKYTGPPREEIEHLFAITPPRW
jgi:hypothetical protein